MILKNVNKSKLLVCDMLQQKLSGILYTEKGNLKTEGIKHQRLKFKILNTKDCFKISLKLKMKGVEVTIHMDNGSL